MSLIQSKKAILDDDIWDYEGTDIKPNNVVNVNTTDFSGDIFDQALDMYEKTRDEQPKLETVQENPKIVAVDPIITQVNKLTNKKNSKKQQFKKTNQSSHNYDDEYDESYDDSYDNYYD